MKLDYFNIYDSLNSACLEAGTTITDVCRKINISRSTPEVWKKKNPKSLQIVGLILAEVEKAKQKKVKKSPKTLSGATGLTR